MRISVFLYTQFFYHLNVQWVIQNNSSKLQIFLLIHGAVLLYANNLDDDEAPLYWWPYIPRVECLSDQTTKYPTGMLEHLTQLAGRFSKANWLQREASHFPPNHAFSHRKGNNHLVLQYAVYPEYVLPM